MRGRCATSRLPNRLLRETREGGRHRCRPPKAAPDLSLRTRRHLAVPANSRDPAGSAVGPVRHRADLREIQPYALAVPLTAFSHRSFTFRKELHDGYRHQTTDCKQASCSTALRSDPRQFDQTIARLSRHLRFARKIPKKFRGVFSDAAAGIAAVSSGPEFPCSYKALTLQERVSRTLPTREGCACKVSRASSFGSSYPQRAMFVVDKSP